jgi:hypothetical protein
MPLFGGLNGTRMRFLPWLPGAATEVHPEPINSRFAYVSVSRASHDAQIYTNSAASLAENLSHDVSKSAAVDFSQSLARAVSEMALGQAL